MLYLFACHKETPQLVCERTARSRVTLRQEGQVELWEWPNELTAGVIVAAPDKQCQYYFQTVSPLGSEEGEDRQFHSEIMSD
jgi:hypothetical protein